MKGLSKYRGLIGLILGLFTILTGCQESPKNWTSNSNSGGALGTSYNITYLGTEEVNFQKEIDSVFEVVNQSLSTYIPDSDISKINRGDTLVVDHMFKDVFNLSKSVFEDTDGYFDPTVGTLVNAWGFGPGQQIQLDSAKVDSLLEYVGFQKVSLNENGEIIKEHPAIQFDFNAVAKGYAIDRLATMLSDKGIENFLVEVGGEIVSRGENKLKDKEWTVGVDDPQAGDARRLKLALKLNDKALASSGNYRKFRIDSVSGKKYVHTIDPKTGFTKNSRVLATSVIAENCARADAFATAFMAMDLDQSIALLSKTKDLEAYIIYLDEEGETQEFFTTGFEERILR